MSVEESAVLTRNASKSEERGYSLVYAWLVVGLLMLAYTLSFLDRQILSLLVTDIKADLGVSDTQIGLLQGLAFSLFYTILGIPIARLADTKNRRNLISVGIFAWSFMTMCCGFAKTFTMLSLARMGVGIGEATLTPAAYSIITDYFPREQLSKALSFYAMGVYIGGGIAFAAGGHLVVYLSSVQFDPGSFFEGMRGWQLAFLAAGAPGIFLSALILLAVREPERRSHDSGEVSADEAIPLREAVRYLRDHWREYFPIYAGFSIHAIAIFATFAWLPTQLIREFGLSVAEAGQSVGSSIFVMGCLGVVVGGVICDRLLAAGRADAPLMLGLVSSVGTCVPFLIAASMDLSAEAVPYVIGSTFFFMAIIAGPAPAAIQLIAPKALRAQLSAVFLFFINFIGMTLGPLLPALISDAGFVESIGTALWIIVLVSCVACGSVFLFGRRAYRALYQRLHED